MNKLLVFRIKINELEIMPLDRDINFFIKHISNNLFAIKQEFHIHSFSRKYTSIIEFSFKNHKSVKNIEKVMKDVLGDQLASGKYLLRKTYISSRAYSIKQTFELYLKVLDTIEVFLSEYLVKNDLSMYYKRSNEKAKFSKFDKFINKKNQTNSNHRYKINEAHKYMSILKSDFNNIFSELKAFDNVSKKYKYVLTTKEIESLKCRIKTYIKNNPTLNYYFNSLINPGRKDIQTIIQAIPGNKFSIKEDFNSAILFTSIPISFLKYGKYDHKAYRMFDTIGSQKELFRYGNIDFFRCSCGSIEIVNKISPICSKCNNNIFIKIKLSSEISMQKLFTSCKDNNVGLTINTYSYAIGTYLNLYKKRNTFENFFYSKKNGSFFYFDGTKTNKQIYFTSLKSIFKKITFTSASNKISFKRNILQELMGNERVEYQAFNVGDYNPKILIDKNFNELCLYLFGINGKLKSIKKSFISLLSYTNSLLNSNKDVNLSFYLLKALAINIKDANNLNKVLCSYKFLYVMSLSIARVESYEQKNIKQILDRYFQILIHWYGENRVCNIISSNDKFNDFITSSKNTIMYIEDTFKCFTYEKYNDDEIGFDLDEDGEHYPFPLDNKQGLINKTYFLNKASVWNKGSYNFILDFHNTMSREYRIYLHNKKRKNTKIPYNDEAKKFISELSDAFKNKYTVVEPKDSLTLLEWGMKLNNCIASYTSNCIRNDFYILGFYSNTIKDKLELALRVNSKFEFKELKGYSNTSPSNEDMKKLKHFLADYERK